MEDYLDYESDEDRFEAEGMMLMDAADEQSQRDLEYELGVLGIEWNKGDTHAPPQKYPKYPGQDELEEIFRQTMQDMHKRNVADFSELSFIIDELKMGLLQTG